jgi:D-alanyl-D-alanine dipeptidase
MKYRLQPLIAFGIVFFSANIICAQSNVVNKYGLVVVKTLKILSEEITIDSNKRMVNLRKSIPGLKLDLKYASKNNFMHRKLYPHIRTTYLRLPAAKALKRVIEELNKKNLSVKIFDAYRPYSVTEEMWEQVKDDRYAANPATGSGHNRGIAVDLTLINLYTQKELPMGTGFDNFSDTAHIDFTNLSIEVLNNRRTLKDIMEKFGFISLNTEWWHFSLPNSSSYELLDLTFDVLQKISIHLKPH